MDAYKTVTLDEATSRLQELVAQASQGEQIVIMQDDHPLARLVPFRRAERVFGQARGRIHVSDDFDEPLSGDFGLEGG